MSVNPNNFGGSRRRIDPQVLQKAVMNVTFTTGEIARLCGVAPRTVSKWFDRGEFLNSHRLPKTTGKLGEKGDRRVTREDLVAFVVKYNIARAKAALGLDVAPLLVLAGVPASMTETLTGLATTDRYEAIRTDDEYETVRAMAGRQPNAIVIHRVFGSSFCRKTIDHLIGRHDEDGTAVRYPRVVVLLGMGDGPDETITGCPVWQTDEGTEPAAVWKFLTATE